MSIRSVGVPETACCSEESVEFLAGVGTAWPEVVADVEDDDDEQDEDEVDIFILFTKSSTCSKHPFRQSTSIPRMSCNLARRSLTAVHLRSGSRPCTAEAILAAAIIDAEDIENLNSVEQSRTKVCACARIFSLSRTVCDNL